MLHDVCYAGTGKSVTGAHVAYALAMKLKKEVQPRRTSSRSQPPRPCVMYCGPSQQSVNVVLGKFWYDWCSLLLLVDVPM